MSNTPVWFITGVSNGMGQLLALRVLKAGHRVVGTVRNPQRAADASHQITSAGGKVITLDLEEPRESIFKKVQAAEQLYGHFDYLVNNAAYSLLGPLESFRYVAGRADDPTWTMTATADHGLRSQAEIEKQFQANVYGPLFVTQAALPTMRKRRSGLIVNFSSVAGQNTNPGIGAYGATKAALEAMSEALSKELVDFGIHVLIVEPGIFRTNFFGAIQTPASGIPESYNGTPAEKAVAHMQQMSGKQPGDPAKAVEKIYEIISGEGEAGKLKGKVLRFAVGQDALDRIDGKMKKFSEDMATSQASEKHMSTAI
ncbi:MAG: hypothetical protein Q9159_004978 [Coniocarpon cinnabarinum]